MVSDITVIPLGRRRALDPLKCCCVIGKRRARVNAARRPLPDGFADVHRQAMGANRDDTVRGLSLGVPNGRDRRRKGLASYGRGR